MPTLPPFWSLVEGHAPELLAHARRLSGTDAEDVFQEALLRALRSYPRLSHGDHLRAWLYRITTTTAFDFAASNGARELSMARVPEIAYRADEPDDGFESLIESLPEGARRALHLRFVEDLEYEVIARRLGCSPAAARQRVSTAVRKLRREME
jgi:RNA polymerase sigma-70 factor (ECF subfamily)